MQLELTARHDFFKDIRSFFLERNFIEVITPCIIPYTVPDANITSISSQWRHGSGFLQTSPEFAMKDIIAKTEKNIFQIAHVFRDEIKSKWHLKEFMMLEWYRVNWSEYMLLSEVKQFLKIMHDREFIFISIIDYLKEIIDIQDPNSWAAIAYKRGLSEKVTHSYDILDFLIQECVYIHSRIRNKWLIYKDFPDHIPGHAACENGLQKRFEIYFEDVEIANGCQEESRADILLDNLRKQQAYAEANGKPVLEIDQEFIINSKNIGNTSGVAIGLDRLFSIKYQRISATSLINLE